MAGHSYPLFSCVTSQLLIESSGYVRGGGILFSLLSHLHSLLDSLDFLDFLFLFIDFIDIYQESVRGEEYRSCIRAPSCLVDSERFVEWRREGRRG